MTRTIPRLLGLVPAHLAVKVGAPGRDRVQTALLIAVARDLAARCVDDGAFSGLEGMNGARTSLLQAVPEEVESHVGVLPRKLWRLGQGAHPRGREQLRPSVLPALDRIG